LLGAIGHRKGFNIWIPIADRGQLDWALTERFEFANSLPTTTESISHVLQEIDIMWLVRGSTELQALFEVEHSTPIYSGLLRFNDFHLVRAQANTPKYSVVASETRRATFSRQLQRPTFSASGLTKACTFLEYSDVYAWHQRLSPGA